MALVTVTANLSNGQIITNTTNHKGGSGVYDDRICPASFWTKVADSLNLPGDHKLVAMHAKGNPTTTSDEAGRVFTQTATVGLHCGEKTGDRYKYGMNEIVYIQVVIVTDYTVT